MLIIMILLCVFMVVISEEANVSKEKEEEKQEWKKKVQSELEEKEKRVTAEHEKSIRDNQQRFEQIIPATGDYRVIDHLFSSNDDQKQYVWCKYHLEGKTCVYCIHRKETINGSGWKYGPNDASHCADRYCKAQIWDDSRYQ